MLLIQALEKFVVDREGFLSRSREQAEASLGSRFGISGYYHAVDNVVLSPFIGFIGSESNSLSGFPIKLNKMEELCASDL